MQVFFSAAKAAFFPADMRQDYERAGTWPADAIEVSEEDFARYGLGSPPKGLRRGADEQGKPTWVPDIAGTPEERRTRQCIAIDRAAGEARAALISPGDLMDAEYAQVLAAVQAWRAAGAPADRVPEELQAGARYAGVSIEQAAADIEQRAAATAQALSRIRSLRLAGKSAVQSAQDSAIEAIGENHIARLRAIARG